MYVYITLHEPLYLIRKERVVSLPAGTYKAADYGEGWTCLSDGVEAYQVHKKELPAGAYRTIVEEQKAQGQRYRA